MAVTYGFFNSINGDRKYNADQMSEYFRGIVNEGVFQHLDGGLAVTAGTGLAVSVAAGRAIIQNRWVQNSAALSLSIAAASETYGRKDAVVIRYNISARSVSITVKTGTPAASPAAPALTRNSTTYEMALAYVNVSAGASSVTVTDKRSDTTVCGWATVAQQTSGEVDAMLNAMKTGFDGVVYDSPALMVQGCDEVLQDEIDDIATRNNAVYDFLEFCPNLIDATKWISSKRVKTTDGTLEGADPMFSASDYIKVDGGIQYIINYSYYSSGDYGCAFYDNSKSFISGSKQGLPTSTTNVPFVFTVPESAAYMRITIINSSYVTTATASFKRYYNPAYASLDDVFNAKTGAAVESICDYVQTNIDSVVEGKYINTNGNETSSSDWGILVVSCQENDNFYVKARGASSVNTIYIIDANGNKVYAKTGNLIDGFYFTIPSGGTTLKVSHAWSYGIACQIKKYMPKNDKCYGVACFGDSLTFGNQDSSGVYYPKELRNSIKYGKYIWDVERDGFGGDKAAEIATMQGGIPVYVRPFTIPATTTAVSIEFICGDETFGTYVPADQNMAYLSDVTISGVKGAITLSSGTYYFTRAEAGDAIEITRPKLIFTHGYDIRNYTQVFWAGTNDNLSATDLEPLTDRIDDMVNFLDSKRYIVIGLTAKTRFADIADINAILSRKYGSHFVDVRNYILSYGLEDAEITPTAQDEIDIANGEIPTSLRADAVHLNQYGYKIVANLVYQKGCDLGYWI